VKKRPRVFLRNVNTFTRNFYVIFGKQHRDCTGKLISLLERMFTSPTTVDQEITQPVRWTLFRHRRANAVEQSDWTGHHLRTIQTIVENVHISCFGQRYPVSER